MLSAKTRKRIKWMALAVIVLVVVVLGALSFFMLHYSLSPDSDSDEQALHRTRTETPWTAAWVDSIRATHALRDTFITRSDGTRMHAWWVRAAQPTVRTAVLVHGYNCQGLMMLKVGYMFHHQL